MAVRLNYADEDFDRQFDLLLAAKRESDIDVSDAVAGIIADVRRHGDAAVLALTAKFDRLDAPSLADLSIGRDEMTAALDGLTSTLRAALQLAADRIRAFHEEQLPQDLDRRDADGIRLGMRHNAVDAAGLYGRAARRFIHHPF